MLHLCYEEAFFLHSIFFLPGRRLVFLRPLVWLVLLVVGAGGCARGDVVATVNRQAITAQEVDKRVSFFELAYGHRLNGSEYRTARGQVLDMMIDEEIIVQEARRRRLIPTAKQVEAEVKRVEDYIRNRVFGGSPRRYEEGLKKAGLTRDDIRRYVERQLMGDMLYRQVTAKVTVTPQEVRSYYDNNRAQFREPERVHLLEIRVNSAEDGQKALQELKNGADFKAVAAKYSTDPLAKRNGGDHGYVTRDRLVQEVADVAFKMKPGETSGIFPSHYALHIVRVEDKKPGKEYTFEEVKDNLRQQMLQSRQRQVFEAFAEELNRKARVTREE